MYSSFCPHLATLLTQVNTPTTSVHAAVRRRLLVNTTCLKVEVPTSENNNLTLSQLGEGVTR